jgi:hypothetical protein
MKSQWREVWRYEAQAAITVEKGYGRHVERFWKARDSDGKYAK